MANNIKDLNDLFKEVYGDKIEDMSYDYEPNWIADTKISREIYKDEIQDERQGEIRIADKRVEIVRSGSAAALFQSQAAHIQAPINALAAFSATEDEKEEE